jgi:hypothetical protein
MHPVEPAVLLSLVPVSLKKKSASLFKISLQMHLCLFINFVSFLDEKLYSFICYKQSVVLLQNCPGQG